MTAQIDRTGKLEVFALTDGHWLFSNSFKGEDAVAAPPLESHTFGLGTLWADQ